MLAVSTSVNSLFLVSKLYYKIPKILKPDCVFDFWISFLLILRLERVKGVSLSILWLNTFTIKLCIPLKSNPKYVGIKLFYSVILFPILKHLPVAIIKGAGLVIEGNNR